MKTEGEMLLSLICNLMKYNPDMHHRRSIRLRGYDYSLEGAYFITICLNHRRRLFGEVKNGEMWLNEFGQTAYREWEKLPERWPHVELGAFQVMPNHIHGIIIIRDIPAVGAPLAGAPTGTQNPNSPSPHINHIEMPDVEWAPNVDWAPADWAPADCAPADWAPARGAPTRDTQIQWAKKPLAGQIAGAYKSCVATECIKIAKSKQPEIELGKLWQRNFWEHIIRNLTAFDRISQYIISNPQNWKSDKFYGKV